MIVYLHKDVELLCRYAKIDYQQEASMKEVKRIKYAVVFWDDVMKRNLRFDSVGINYGKAYRKVQLYLEGLNAIRENRMKLTERFSLLEFALPKHLNTAYQHLEVEYEI